MEGSIGIKTISVPQTLEEIMKGTKLLRTCGFVLTVLIVAASSASGQNAKPSYPKSGLYIGLIAPQTGIGGDFDGTKLVVATGEAVVIPKIDSKLGLGFRIGYRTSSLAYELSRVSQTLSATWAGAPTTVKASTYSFDIKYLTKPFLVSEFPSQFFGLIGVAIPSLTVKDGAIASSERDYYGSEFEGGDGHFLGFGLNMGIGLDVALQDRIIASACLGYRLLNFAGAKGVSGDLLRVQDGIKGSGTTMSVGLSFTL
jgi:hypothetical protein